MGARDSRLAAKALLLEVGGECPNVVFILFFLGFFLCVWGESHAGLSSRGGGGRLEICKDNGRAPVHLGLIAGEGASKRTGNLLLPLPLPLVHYFEEGGDRKWKPGKSLVEERDYRVYRYIWVGYIGRRSWGRGIGG